MDGGLCAVATAAVVVADVGVVAAVAGDDDVDTVGGGVMLVGWGCE